MDGLTNLDAVMYNVLNITLHRN